jgi:hypothetical protein
MPPIARSRNGRPTVLTSSPLLRAMPARARGCGAGRPRIAAIRYSRDADQGHAYVRAIGACRGAGRQGLQGRAYCGRPPVCANAAAGTVPLTAQRAVKECEYAAVSNGRPAGGLHASAPSTCATNSSCARRSSPMRRTAAAERPPPSPPPPTHTHTHKYTHPTCPAIPCSGG